MASTTKLTLDMISASQAQKHITHNEALLALDQVVQSSVLDRDLTTPPGSPSDGDAYIPASGATGDWAGKDLNIAAWQDGVWRFYAPRAGWLCFVEDEGLLLSFDGAAWVDLTAVIGVLQNLSMLGINTTADATNRLSVAADAVLFNHNGSGIQHKLNKNAAGDSASTLFQTNWSGRAEVGLTGDDDFHFKVSPNGSTWYDAITIDKSSGQINFSAAWAIARTSPSHDLQDTAVATSHQVMRQYYTGNDYSLRVRNSTGAHVAFASVATIAATGVTRWKWYIGAVAAFQLDSAGKAWLSNDLDVAGDTIMNGSLTVDGRLKSREITITDDNIGQVTTPHAGGFALIMLNDHVYPQAARSGLFAYDVGGSLLLVDLVLGGILITNQNTTTLTGTTGPDGSVNIGVKANQIVIENRHGSTQEFSVTFLG